MTPDMLIDKTAAAGLPAPAWFIELFKVLGFSLHAVPMNLWYAGILVAMLLHWRGGQEGRRLSSRLLSQMPVIIAMGVNFGIVPLLFIQVGFAKIFYPATLLMAWPWLAVIRLLIPAYYGVYVYVYAFALRAEAEGRPMPTWSRATGWLAAGLFMAIGFIFANAMSLMENIDAWPRLWQQNGASGVVWGTALNVADPRFLPRWLLMFGLALGTTGAWTAFDAGWFARRETPEYRAWATGFAWKLYALGAAWFAVAGSWYVFGTWSTEVREAMFAGPLAPLTAVTAIAPAAVLALLWWGRGNNLPGRWWASLVGVAQFGLLGVNAVSRQVVQNLDIGRFYNIFSQPTDVQWGPMALFLGSFVLGLAIVAWMIVQVAKLPAKPERA
jgi:hypothetical protein